MIDLPTAPPSTSAEHHAANDPGDPLARLVVIDRLTLGVPKVTPRKISATVSVERDGQRAETELSYRYDENVFAPSDPLALNLATLVLAQPLLNYGLFCREIVFEGPTDRHDRRFLAEAARNTAREIYVNKLLVENPFLVGVARDLPLVRRESYLAAELRFGQPCELTTSAPWAEPKGGAPHRHAVLSSGGKESLLSYGLLAELGDVDPIFVNESGRHWFTALTAYRDFEGELPLTARVWTDVDRLYGFMLRQLPFVRADFARQRADIYPLRLWTVAQFVFGALPLLRARGVGRLVVGDEFDTTSRARHEGIPHYDGLYDQSRFFDEALTRFYQRKGWGVLQFSILRPLSELLIEKALAERYPELLALQVSCHAARVEEGRSLPCGRCEKCRRVVGMLVALGQQPGRVGYDDASVKACLDALATSPPHQERPAVEQLAAMLAQRGLLPGGALGEVKAAPRPEILGLRFDAEHAPLDGLPRDLREPLYLRLLEHADGAWQRRGRRWHRVDLFAEGLLARPYPFAPTTQTGGARTEARDYLLGELTWPRAKSRLAEVDLALLPVGALEQHGPHLPLDTDAYDAELLARQVAAACSAPRPLVLPLIPYGVSYHHDDFAGTVSVSPDTLAQLVYEVGMRMARQGITKLVIVNGHGGNGPALHFAAQKINRDARIFTCVDTGETSDADIDELCSTDNDVHAGEIETSTTLHLRPELVDLDRARPSVPRFSSRYLDFSSRRAVGWYVYTRRISEDGTMGDPTRASAAKGAKMWGLIVEHLLGLVEELKALSLDEIHQRRY